MSIYKPSLSSISNDLSLGKNSGTGGNIFTKIIFAGDANCRLDLYPPLCHRTHGVVIFPIIFSLKIISKWLRIYESHIFELRIKT